MSLSTRVISGLAAAAVVGAGLVGYGIYQAVDNGAPEKNLATLVVGTSSITSEPDCYNDGKPIDDAALDKCATDAQSKSNAKKLAHADVRASDRIGIGVPKDLAKKGWYAFTGSGNNRTPIITNAAGLTYSGSMSAANLMTTGDQTSVTVAIVDKATNEYYAVWFFDLNNKTS